MKTTYVIVILCALSVGLGWPTGLARTRAADSNPVNELNDAGFSQLHYAAMHGKADQVRHLIAQGADFEIAQGKFLGRPLQYAASHGRVAAAEALLQAGADVDSTDKFGRTPLMWATTKNHFDVVKLLIEYEADVNAKTKTRWTALKYARQAEATPIVEFLQEHGAIEATAPINSRTGLPPNPFYCRSMNDPQRELQWNELLPSDLDVAINISGLTKLDDDKVILQVTVVNRSDRKIRMQPTHQWHGGEWPATDLYARVRPANGPSNMFHPVYLAGEHDGKGNKRKLKPGKQVTFELRMDWPGTGSALAQPQIDVDQAGTYFVQVLLIIHVNGKAFYRTSPEVAVNHLGSCLDSKQ